MYWSSKRLLPRRSISSSVLSHDQLIVKDVIESNMASFFMVKRNWSYINKIHRITNRCLLDGPDGWGHKKRKIWAIQYLNVLIWKSGFCVMLEVTQFNPARVVYYVRRFHAFLGNIYLHYVFHQFLGVVFLFVFFPSLFINSFSLVFKSACRYSELMKNEWVKVKIKLKDQKKTYFVNLNLNH